jgi:hypothetical protein
MDKDEQEKAAEAFEKAHEFLFRWGNDRGISAYKYDFSNFIQKAIKHLEEKAKDAQNAHHKDMEQLGLTPDPFPAPESAEANCPCCGTRLLKAEAVRIDKALPYAAEQMDYSASDLNSFVCLNCSRVYVPKIRKGE